MSTKPDEFDVAKTISQALQPFDLHQKEKIIRWVCESLNLTSPTSASTTQSQTPAVISPSQQQLAIQSGGKNIKTFITEKAPKSDNQLAAAVAYYYMFEAPEGQRKTAINKDDLQEATRLAGLDRLKRPDQTLVNAHNVGILDKGERGTYTINTVGENLVAMTMPSATGKVSLKKKKKPQKKSAAKKK